VAKLNFPVGRVLLMVQVFETYTETVDVPLSGTKTKDPSWALPHKL